MEHTAPNYVRCAVTPEVKATNGKSREVLHLISNAAVDRAGDVVEPGGIDVANFLKNPIVMVDHDYRTEKIIGKSVSTEVNEDGMFSRTRFRDTPLAKDAYSLASEGIGGWSIGFRPIEYESRKDEKGNFKGFHFKRVELLEYSFVAVPMNQEVVAACVQRGLVHDGTVSTLFKSGEMPSPPAAAARDNAKVVEAEGRELDSVLEALSGLKAHNEAQDCMRGLRDRGI